MYNYLIIFYFTLFRPLFFYPRKPISSAYRLFQTQNRHGGNNTASTLKHLIGMVLFRWQNIAGSAIPVIPIRFGHPRPNPCSGMYARME